MFDADDEDLDLSLEMLCSVSRRRTRAAMIAAASVPSESADQSLVSMF